MGGSMLLLQTLKVPDLMDENKIALLAAGVE